MMQWGKPKSWNAKKYTPYTRYWWDRSPLRARDDFTKVEIPFHSGAETVTMSVPIPDFAANPDAIGADRQKPKGLQDAFSLAKGAKKLPRDTVIIGVVDTGIPLSHRRFRTPDGGTRFLAAWQQTAAWGTKKQKYLPFGRELYQSEIDGLLAEFGADLDGPIDEDAFNRAADLVEPNELFGLRDLEHSASHGAHVLDLAAGVDPTSPASKSDALLDCRIIAVNLPPMYIHGSAGNFLTIFAELAVERILRVADAIWEVQHGDTKGGFPVVINFSFGKQAGPKNGNTVWEQAIQEMIAERQQRAPTMIVMPAGNQNLARGNARKMLGKKGQTWPPGGKKADSLSPELEVPWRIQPNDQTANFLEVWFKSLGSDDREEADPLDFKLFVTPPGEAELEVPSLNAGQYSDLGAIARVYSYCPPGETRPHFIIAVNPTDTLSNDVTTGPAGLWTVRVIYSGDDPQEATICIQSDQAGISNSLYGMGSYFDHENYRAFLESGRIRDSYDECGSREPWSEYGPVQRKGTQNALATWKDAISISGYRLSDAKPVTFSSTFDGNRQRLVGKATPTVSYPTDISPSHYGLLAAGSKEGSIIAFQGTSMASALATRDLARVLADRSTNLPYDQKTAEAWLRKSWRPYRRISTLKTGAGVKPMPAFDRIARLGEEEAELPMAPPPPRARDCS